MRLPRRTFLGLLAGLAAMAVSVARALAWPSWWRKAADEQDAAASRATTSDNAGSSGVKITTVEYRTFRDSAQDLNRDPTVFYVRGDWRRLEWPRSYSGGAVRPNGTSERNYGPRVATIVRPDLGRMFELNLDASEYTSMAYAPKKPRPFTKAEMETLGIRVPPSPAQGAQRTVRIETTTHDTGERKEMFGYLARHVITTRREIPFGGSSRGAQEEVTDAWYIDLEPRFYPSVYARNLPVDDSGKPRRAHSFVTAYTKGSTAPLDVPEFVDIGEPETGFAVQEKRTSRSSFKLPDGSTGQREGRSETTVTIEKGKYDAALFEVPRGFRPVSQIQRNPT